jgi:hypothetical protein
MAFGIFLSVKTSKLLKDSELKKAVAFGALFIVIGFILFLNGIFGICGINRHKKCC